jgi:hydroxyethylthiazole kinase-like uncharacterized protein yjeF
MQRVHPGDPLPLFGPEPSRALEAQLKATLAPHTLMPAAGLAVARLALAIAPHAQAIWLACGPGDNGGDGLVAAAHLQARGKRCHVSWLGSPGRASADTQHAWEQAQAAGVHWCDDLAACGEAVGLCIDALLGLGSQNRPIEGRLAHLIDQLSQASCPVLAVDIPSGLNPQTGMPANHCVHASHTLSLLTLKPGLFTGHGRDASGEIWLDELHPAARQTEGLSASAQLMARPQPLPDPHASHKGSFGDVVIIGGAVGMSGAAMLAGSAALHGGAGRVLVALLDPAAPSHAWEHPELMLRQPDTLDLTSQVVVCGCGGSRSVQAVLPDVLALGSPLVLDADALNAIAAGAPLAQALRGRHSHGAATVLTPHPLEAARLLGCTKAEVQHDRLAAAQHLSERFACCVVLKGSGSLVAAPGQSPAINPTGNAKLATAGTGDVLAGLIGARLAQGFNAWEAACSAVYLHGELADHWPAQQALTAQRLAQALRRT